MLSHAKPNQAALASRDWLTLGGISIGASIMLVVFFQAFARALWPDISLFEPLNSIARSMLFTAIPVAGATAVFAFLDRRVAEPAKLFTRIAIAVLVISMVPDYLLPVANKTFLASSVTAFLHVVAGITTILILQLGYKQYQPKA